MPKPFEIDRDIMKVVYEERFNGDPGDDSITHLKSLRKDVILLK
jgi:hypothetical protein